MRARQGFGGPFGIATLPRLVNAALLAGLFIGSAVVWPGLPGELPVHFDLAGNPDRWVEKSLLAWFGMPVVAVGLTLVMEWVAQLAVVHPDYLNIPNKEAFLALPTDHRNTILLRMRDLLGWIAVTTTAMLVLVQTGVYMAARGGRAGPAIVFGVVVGGLVLPAVAILGGRRIGAGILTAAEE